MFVPCINVDFHQFHPICPYEVVDNEVKTAVELSQRDQQAKERVTKVYRLKCSTEVVNTLSQTKYCKGNNAMSYATTLNIIRDTSNASLTAISHNISRSHIIYTLGVAPKPLLPRQ